MKPRSFQFIIAEDNQNDRFLVEHTISRTFPTATIHSFSDGTEALQRYMTHGADAIVTDHSMPQMCGSDLVRAIRERDGGVVIVMVSSSPYGREEGLKAGVQVFMEKDEVMERLPGALLSLLPQ